MSTTTAHAFLVYVAERMASREVDALADFHGVGSLIVKGDLTYDAARDQMVALGTERNIMASTVKVYVSQGYALAQLFPTFAEVEEFADDEVKGSRSLKRIYDATRKAAKADEPEVAGEPEAVAEVVITDADRAASILSILAAMTDAAAIASVRDAAAAMLTPQAVAV